MQLRIPAHGTSLESGYYRLASVEHLVSIHFNGSHTFKMPLTQNRAAFRATRTLPGTPPLLNAYTAMVCLELFLKDHLAATGAKPTSDHNVPSLLLELGRREPVHTGALNSLSAQLIAALSALWCETKSGAPGRVRSKSYPDMRYLRHNADWPSSSSADAELLKLVAAVSQIERSIQQATGKSV